MNIIELMDIIEDDAGRFLQADCIFQLRAFMRGFVIAKNVSSPTLSFDHQIMDEIDSIVRKEYDVLPSAVISIEEILDDFEAGNAFNKYLEIWAQNVNKIKP